MPDAGERADRHALVVAAPRARASTSCRWWRRSRRRSRIPRRRSPQPTMLAWRSRPGRRVSHGARPLNMSSDSRVRNRISPIQMNSGSEVSAQLLLELNTVVAITLPIGAEENSIMPTAPTPMSDERDPDAGSKQEEEHRQQDDREDVGGHGSLWMMRAVSRGLALALHVDLGRLFVARLARPAARRRSRRGSSR